ncbi:F-box domain-containing protein [Caenorhabditis elegans]|uniref:F-box domain-containing protein n=1 Tax=Caenorhabditis elegans TaxID=6239 RepID=P91222_CAEEL|nr:F-box domain-containing protein [Caenorhabditis elegans]CCD61273.1 F-box domain-containing protein [Caenorhabditis elegans]|eukprot:NP_494167.1 F-box B protein [Caenorhabditis elegans]
MPTVPFPILRLPNAILQRSLQQMSPIGLISLSVLSNNMKQIVTMPNNKSRFDGRISTTLPITLHLNVDRNSRHHYVEYAFQFNQSVLRIQDIRGQEPATLTKPGFTDKLWIEHVAEVLFQNKGVILSCDAPFRTYIKELLKNINVTLIAIRSSGFEVWKFFELFPSLEKVTFTEGPIPLSVLSRNLDGLKVNTKDVPLDDALTSNSLSFAMHRNSFTMKEINLFIKQWIRGCNPRLEMFQILFNDIERHLVLENVIFKGINYIEKRNRIVQCQEREEYRIERFDGTEALVWFNPNRFPFLEMTVMMNDDDDKLLV